MMLLTPGLLRGLVPCGELGFYGGESGSGDPVVVTKWVYRVVLSHAWVCVLHLMCCFVDVREFVDFDDDDELCWHVCNIIILYSVVILLFNNVILTPSACVYVHP